MKKRSARIEESMLYTVMVIAYDKEAALKGLCVAGSRITGEQAARPRIIGHQTARPRIIKEQGVDPRL